MYQTCVYTEDSAGSNSTWIMGNSTDDWQKVYSTTACSTCHNADNHLEPTLGTDMTCSVLICHLMSCGLPPSSSSSNPSESVWALCSKRRRHNQLLYLRMSPRGTAIKDIKSKQRAHLSYWQSSKIHRRHHLPLSS
jgi:hypothetical protein